MNITTVVMDIRPLIEENHRLKTEKKQITAKYTQISEINFNKSLKELKAENIQLREENAALKRKILSLEERSDNIEAKLFQFDVREAFRALERYIILDVVGSKMQMITRRINTIADLQKTTEYAISKWCSEKETKILGLIEYFKDGDHIVIHNGELPSSKQDLIIQLQETVSEFEFDQE
jgi:broad-specificity NMP kinase